MINFGFKDGAPFLSNGEERNFFTVEQAEKAEMLGVAKGTVFNYIKRFKIKRIYV